VDRGCYKQWEEANVPLTVVFEVVSPTLGAEEMIDKQFFYEDHGVEEYYFFNPETNRLIVYVRRGEILRPVRLADSFVSPRLGIRFDLSGPEMVVYGPDGQRFLSFEELKTLYEQAQKRAEQAQRDAELALQIAQQAQQEAQQAQERAVQEQKRAVQAEERALQAQEQAVQAKEHAQKARQEADKAQLQARGALRRVMRLAELSRKARLQKATPEELQELERLENESISAP
jgi:hypothetical protein